MEARRAPALAALRNFPRVEKTAPPVWAAESLSLAARRGYAYERKVGKVLNEICSTAGWGLLDHQWFMWICGKDVKYFQPDFIIQRPNEQGILIEVKLTYVDANAQLNKYLQYLKLFGLDCFSAIAVRHLTKCVSRDAVIDDFSKLKPNSVWHLWI